LANGARFWLFFHVNWKREFYWWFWERPESKIRKRSPIWAYFPLYYLHSIQGPDPAVDHHLSGIRYAGSSIADRYSTLFSYDAGSEHSIIRDADAGRSGRSSAKSIVPVPQAAWSSFIPPLSWKCTWQGWPLRANSSRLLLSRAWPTSSTNPMSWNARSDRRSGCRKWRHSHEPMFSIAILTSCSRWINERASSDRSSASREMPCMYAHGKYPGCTTSVSAWMLSQIPQSSSITPSPAVRIRSLVLARLISESGACTEYRASTEWQASWYRKRS